MVGDSKHYTVEQLNSKGFLTFYVPLPIKYFYYLIIGITSLGLRNGFGKFKIPAFDSYAKALKFYDYEFVFDEKDLCTRQHLCLES